MSLEFAYGKVMTEVIQSTLDSDKAFIPSSEKESIEAQEQGLANFFAHYRGSYSDEKALIEKLQASGKNLPKELLDLLQTFKSHLDSFMFIDADKLKEKEADLAGVESAMASATTQSEKDWDQHYIDIYKGEVQKYLDEEDKLAAPYVSSLGNKGTEASNQDQKLLSEGANQETRYSQGMNAINCIFSDTAQTQGYFIAMGA